MTAHVSQLTRSGAAAVVVCGGVAEFFALDEQEHSLVYAAAVDGAEGRTPVIAGVGYSTRVAMRLAEQAALAGVDGLMINPAYFLQPSPEGWQRHYRTLATLGLGLMIYSTGDCMHSPETLQLLVDVDEVIAFKDEQGDLGNFQLLREKVGDRLLWVNGMGELYVLPYAAAGATGLSSGIINFAPELVLGLWEDVQFGRLDRAFRTIRDCIRPIALLRERRPGYAIAVVKEAMALRGICEPSIREPLMRLNGRELDELRAILRLVDAYASEAATIDA